MDFNKDLSHVIYLYFLKGDFTSFQLHMHASVYMNAVTLPSVFPLLKDFSASS